MRTPSLSIPPSHLPSAAHPLPRVPSFARSMLLLSRQDTEEVNASTKLNKRRGGIIHKPAAPVVTPEMLELLSQASQGTAASGGSKAGNTQPSGPSRQESDEQEEERNRIFTEIQDLKKTMKRHDEPHEVALTIARLYVTLSLQKLSIPFFKMASKIVPYHPPRIHPQDQQIENRKMERMGKDHRAKYLEEKEAEAKLIKEEHAERQRVRVLNAHYEIFLAHLSIHNSTSATDHMRAWLGMSRTEEELTEMRFDLDGIISQYHDLNDLGNGHWKDKGYDDVRMRMDGTLGSLRDLHLETLEALLLLEPRNPSHLLKLSRLHAFVRNYERAQHLYETYIDVKEGAQIADMKSYKHNNFYYDKLTRSPRFRNEFGRSADDWGYSQGALGAAPSRIASYDVDSSIDRLADSTRRDFVEFRMGDMAKRTNAGEPSQVSGGKHIGSTTIIYTLPPGGWQDDETPMRTSKGGMRAAQSSGKEVVEDDVRRVRHRLSQGYRAPEDSVTRVKNIGDLRKATVTAENSDIYKAAGKLEVREMDGLDYVDAKYRLPAELGGGLKLPLPTFSKEGAPHQVRDPAWSKGGALPPRLHDLHDFRAMPHHELANPDIVIKRATMSVFDAENQKFDLDPVIRYRHNGSALTGREGQRLERIKAKEGRFGGIVEMPIRTRLVQTFAGRVEKPTKVMVDSHSRLDEKMSGKKVKKKTGLAKKKEAIKLQAEIEKKKGAVHTKITHKLERKFTQGLGGRMIPVNTKLRKMNKLDLTSLKEGGDAVEE